MQIFSCITNYIICHYVLYYILHCIYDNVFDILLRHDMTHYKYLKKSIQRKRADVYFSKIGYNKRNIRSIAIDGDASEQNNDQAIMSQKMHNMITHMIHHSIAKIFTQIGLPHDMLSQHNVQFTSSHTLPYITSSYNEDSNGSIGQIAAKIGIGLLHAIKKNL